MTPYEFPICTMLTAQESNRNARRVVSAGAENAEGQQEPKTPSIPSAQDYGVFCANCGHAKRYHVNLSGRPTVCDAHKIDSSELCGCRHFKESRTFKMCDFCNGSGYAINVITLERRPCPQCKGEGGETVSPAAQTAADAGDAHAVPDVPLAAQSASPDFYPRERRISDRQLWDHLEFMEGA